MYSIDTAGGQRKAAEATRKQFGLSSFAHTTLGRALKTFAHNIEEVEKTLEKSNRVGLKENEKEIEAQNVIAVENIFQEKTSVDRHSFPTRRSTEPLRYQASKLLSGKAIQVCREQFIKLCYELVRKWFREYQRFLL